MLHDLSWPSRVFSNLRLELIDVTIDPPPELQLPTPAPVTVQAVPVPAVPAAGFTSLECTMQEIPHVILASLLTVHLSDTYCICRHTHTNTHMYYDIMIIFMYLFMCLFF